MLTSRIAHGSRSILVLGLGLILLIVSISLVACSVEPTDGPSRAKYATKHHFNGFSLPSPPPSSPAPCLLQDFYDLVHEKYGDRMLTWRVKEVDDTNWVFAFPNGITKKRNLATMDLFQAFVEGYSDEATCSKREGFELLFPLIDNTAPQQ